MCLGVSASLSFKPDPRGPSHWFHGASLVTRSKKREERKKIRVKRSGSASGPRLSKRENKKEEKHNQSDERIYQSFHSVSKPFRTFCSRIPFVFLLPIVWITVIWEWDILVHRFPMAI